jgi:hypothetical protein
MPSTSPRADADMACRHAGEHRSRQGGFAIDRLAGQDRRQRPRGRNAKRVHRFGYDILPQHRPKGRPSVAPAGKRRFSCPFQLDIPAHTLAVDDLAQQDRASVAKLRHEIAELVAGIGHGDRHRAFRQAVAGKDRSQLLIAHPGKIEVELLGERSVEADQPRCGDRSRVYRLEKTLGKPRITIVERKQPAPPWAALPSVHADEIVQH